jgi:uncharacterized protein (DUF433 family)
MPEREAGARKKERAFGFRLSLKCTRMGIIGLLERLAAGETIDEIVTGYRGRVTPEAIREAVSLVTREFLNALPALQPAEGNTLTNNRAEEIRETPH